MKFCGDTTNPCVTIYTRVCVIRCKFRSRRTEILGVSDPVNCHSTNIPGKSITCQATYLASRNFYCTWWIARWHWTAGPRARGFLCVNIAEICHPRTAFVTLNCSLPINPLTRGSTQRAIVSFPSSYFLLNSQHPNAQRYSVQFSFRRSLFLTYFNADSCLFFSFRLFAMLRIPSLFLFLSFFFCRFFDVSSKRREPLVMRAVYLIIDEVVYWTRTIWLYTTVYEY